MKSFIKSLSQAQAEIISSSRIPELDGVRGLAILMVLLVHAWGFAGAPHLLMESTGLDVTFLFSMSQLGVDLFFVLSGYLLFAQYIRRHLRGLPHPSYFSFLQRRLRRILPAYFLLLFVVFIVMPPANYLLRLDLPAGWANLISHILFVHNFDLRSVQMYPMLWTLGVEMQFYLLLPAVAYITLRGHRWKQKVFAAWLISMILYILSFFNIIRIPVNHISLPHHLNEFLTGYIAAIFVSAIEEDKRLKNCKRPISHLCSVLGLALIVYIMFLSNVLLSRQMYLLYAPAGIAFAILLIGAVTSEGILNRIWTNKVMMSLGIVSYGVYLWHFPLGQNISQFHLVRLISDPFLKTFTVLGIMLPLSILTGYASYIFIESPFLLKKSRAGVPVPPAAPPLAMLDQSGLVPPASCSSPDRIS